MEMTSICGNTAQFQDERGADSREGPSANVVPNSSVTLARLYGINQAATNQAPSTAIFDGVTADGAQGSFALAP
jgi:hypothetical protein